jgi:hypothetical protein
LTAFEISPPELHALDIRVFLVTPTVLGLSVPNFEWLSASTRDKNPYGGFISRACVSRSTSMDCSVGRREAQTATTITPAINPMEIKTDKVIALEAIMALLLPVRPAASQLPFARTP